MAQYATADDLAAYLQIPVNEASMDLQLQLASAAFDTEARTTFTPTAVMYAAAGDGAHELTPPRFPLVSVESVTINGTAVTDWTLVDATLYRECGWGDPCVFPPDAITVNYTYGFDEAPDDVRAAVLTIAAQFYTNPTAAEALSIDDYRASYGTSQSNQALPALAVRVAAKYRRAAASIGQRTQVVPAPVVSTQWYSPMNDLYGGGVVVP